VFCVAEEKAELLQDLGAIFLLLFLEVGLAVGLAFVFWFFWLLFVVLSAFDFFPTRPTFSSFFYRVFPPPSLE
jgi:hypothetical protein